MLGIFILTTFLVSLPWPWYVVASVGSFGVRPVYFAAIPVIIYFLWKSKFSLKPVNLRVIVILSCIYAIWTLPVVYNAYPHWQIGKLVSLGGHIVIAYFAARLYLLLSLDKKWGIYWPIASAAFLISCALSYYYAFGTLIPDTNITTSRDFIHGALYSQGEFSDPEAAKGIRHTMAIVPTLLLALVAHNSRHASKLNIAIYVAAVYLVLFSFSRSAWLVAFLISLLVFRYVFKHLSKNITIIVLFLFGVALALPILSMMFPQQFAWVWNILGDRIGDDKSTSGRLWILGEIFLNTSFAELLFGYNRVMPSPHNLVFDALLQTGILGAIGAVIITIYAIRIYILGLHKGNYESIVAAAMVTPALVRIFTAGSGMLHIADLLGLCIAANLTWYFNERAGYKELPKNPIMVAGMQTSPPGKILAWRKRFNT